MIDHLILGPPTHGVTRHGAALAGAERTLLESVGTKAEDLRGYLTSDTTPVHVHLTDHLLGDDTATIERSIDLVATANRPVHVTLHDIPQEAEGQDRYRRRRALYARLVEVSASVQVCSESERRMVDGMVERSDIGVVPLPVDVSAEGVARARRGREESDGLGPIGVLGFVHPGKNPELAVDLAEAVGRDVVLLGAVVPGHEAFFADLQRDARRRGVTVTATGYLDEEALDAAIGTIAVPLAPHRHISASGSIGRWVAAGRRPLVLPTAWAQEFAERVPWAVRVVDADELRRAVVAAGEEPASTWTGGRADGLVSTADAAAAQAAYLGTVARG